MGSMSVWHWLILLVIGLLVFGGKGKISSIMGDMAEGIKSFKKGMADDEVTKEAEEKKKLEMQKTVDNVSTSTKTS
jgi:sec-independent protein translocase protein TatA